MESNPNPGQDGDLCRDKRVYNIRGDTLPGSVISPHGSCTQGVAEGSPRRGVLRTEVKDGENVSNGTVLVGVVERKVLRAGGVRGEDETGTTISDCK